MTIDEYNELIKVRKSHKADRANKKVRNATKLVVEGVKFDSKLEKHMYDLLRASRIDFEFQKVYTLQNKFRYGTEAIRAITLTVDFWLPKYNILIDTKGHQTQQGALRWKMLKWLFVDYLKAEPLPKIFLPKTKTECEMLVMRIKLNRDEIKGYTSL